MLLETLLDHKRGYLNTLLEPDRKDAARQDAYQKIATLLLSPVLRSVLASLRTSHFDASSSLGSIVPSWGTGTRSF